jgi:fructose-specific phosphotransferase system IIA component
MKISELISCDTIKLELEAKDKKNAVRELVTLLVEANRMSEDKEIINAVLDREKKGSTGIGYGVGLPHCKSEYVSGLIVAFGRSSKGIEFASLDNKPVRIIFLLISSNKSVGPHLKVLAKISRLLKGKRLRRFLLEAKTKEEIIDLLND